MNMAPFATYLAGQGVGVVGVSLFADFMPAAAQSGILLVSPLSGTPIDHELPGYFKTGFQLIARHADINQAKALADQAVVALTMKNTDQIAGLHVNYIRPRHQPVPFPQSEGNLWEVSVNFDANYCEL